MLLLGEAVRNRRDRIWSDRIRTAAPPIAGLEKIKTIGDAYMVVLWGDTVNMASRMESHGLPGCIQVTCRTYQRLRDHYRFEQRGNNAT